MLASRLAYLNGGDNQVKGMCGPGDRCTVSVHHANGEDVESAEYRFRLVRGKLDPRSLRCWITP